MAKRNHFRSSQQKNYRAQRFKNPYFQDKRISPRLIFVISIGIFLIICSSIFFFAMSNRFAIKRININGTHYFSEELFKDVLTSYIHKPFLIFFDHANRFVFNSDDLQNVLESKFAFESISIHRTGDSLLIDIKEKQSQIIWQSGKNQYVVDLEGIIIRELSEEERTILSNEPGIIETNENQLLRDLPVFVDRNEVQVSIGSQVLTNDEMTNIFLFHKLLQLQNIQVINTQIDRLAGKWIGIKTADGYEILFDATGDTNIQASRLEVILREKIEDETQLQYIDLRFGDHVYFQ